MQWETPLTEAVLIKRYKRFLADVRLGAETLTVHVPNTGSMTGCWAPEWQCAVSRSKNPTRKMPYTLELTHNGETWIGVNTANANKLARQWIDRGLIPELLGYAKITPEKKVGDSRIDFYMESHLSLPPAYVEVKSVTLKLNGVAQFPDAVSERAQKHVRELIALKKQGFRAVLLYIVQRQDVHSVQPARAIDPTYASLLEEAQLAGVEVLAYQGDLDLSGIRFGRSLPVTLG